LDSIKDNYGYDSGKSIVAYFLSNAAQWKGETAKIVKKELKKRIGLKEQTTNQLYKSTNSIHRPEEKNESFGSMKCKRCGTQMALTPIAKCPKCGWKIGDKINEEVTGKITYENPQEVDNLKYLLLSDKPKRTTVKKAMKFSSTVIPEGTELVVFFSNKIHGKIFFRIIDDPKIFTVPLSAAHKYLTGFNSPPSLKTLEKWTFDQAVVTTPTGKRVEADGVGPDGSPSWLLVMGMI
jgi:ribosomal protein L37E